MKIFNFLLSSILLVLLTVIFSRCAKDKLMSFELDSKVYIYKDSRNAERDSMTYSFEVQPPDTELDTVLIPIRIMGGVSNRDREVKYEVLAGSDARDDVYELLPAIIPAGSYEGQIPIKVKKTEELRSKDMRLWIRIVGSKDLEPGPSDQVSYLLKINNRLTKPESWLQNYFGDYSSAKYGLIIRATGYTEYDDSTLWFYILQTSKNALLDYKEQTGEDYLDEDGQSVTFPM